MAQWSMPSGRSASGPPTCRIPASHRWKRPCVESSCFATLSLKPCALDVEIIHLLGHDIQRFNEYALRRLMSSPRYGMTFSLTAPRSCASSERTRPFRGFSRSFARNAAEAVEQQNVLTVFIGCDDFLEAIDDLRLKHAAFFEAVKRRATKCCRKLTSSSAFAAPMSGQQRASYVSVHPLRRFLWAKSVSPKSAAPVPPSPNQSAESGYETCPM